MSVITTYRVTQTCVFRSSKNSTPCGQPSVSGDCYCGYHGKLHNSEYAQLKHASQGKYPYETLMTELDQVERCPSNFSSAYLNDALKRTNHCIQKREIFYEKFREGNVDQAHKGYLNSMKRKRSVIWRELKERTK
jgi:hypothetical protein